MREQWLPLQSSNTGAATARRRFQSPEIAMRRNTRQGFTLIELLIVVVIIGILAAIAIPKFANTKEKAYVAQMKSDLRNLVNAEEAFFADSVHYTATMAQLNYRQSTGVGVPTIAVGAGFWSATI